MLDVRRLRLLRELKLRGTIAAVASALSYTPSAVSQQLALLEEEARVPLLVKAGRRVQLTPEAELLVEHTVALLERLELMEAEIHSSLTEVRGTVRLAVFQSAALGVIPQALSVIAREHPQLRIEMTQREPESALFETWTREFDLVIAEQYPGHAAARHPDLDMIPLYADELSLAVPGGSGITTLADAAGGSWVMEPRGTASRHWAEQQCRRVGIEPDVRFETADLQAHIRLVESGHATAILPGLIWGSRTPTVELRTMPGLPRRTVFTSVRESSVRRPSIVACRTVFEQVVKSFAPE